MLTFAQGAHLFKEWIAASLLREIPARRARVPTSKPWTAQRIRPPPESVFEIYKVGITGPGIQTSRYLDIQISSVTQKALLAKVCEHRTLSPWWAVFSCLILWRVRSLCLVAFNWSSLVWSGRSASNLLTGLLRVSPTVLAQTSYIPQRWEHLLSARSKTLVMGWYLVHWSAIPLMSTMFVPVSAEKLPRKFARKALNLWIQRVPPPDRTTFGSIVQR